MVARTDLESVGQGGEEEEEQELVEAEEEVQVEDLGAGVIDDWLVIRGDEVE